MWPTTPIGWAKFTAAVFVAGAIIGTVAQFLPVLNTVRNGVALTRS